MKDFRELLKDEGNITGIRLFKHVAIEDFSLSIQASQHHYCDPRETLNDVYSYNSFEVALFEKDKWVIPSKDERFVNFASGANETSRTSVFANMPVADVQRLYEVVCALVGAEGQG